MKSAQATVLVVIAKMRLRAKRDVTIAGNPIGEREPEIIRDGYILKQEPDLA